MDGNVEILIVVGLLEFFGEHSDSKTTGLRMPGKILFASRNQFFLRRSGTVVGRITQSNKAFCDFRGYSEPELFGKTVLSITHPDDREASSRAITRSFAAGHCIQRFDKRYLHKCGRVLGGEVTSTVICDAEGKPSYSIAQVLDINERKQAEVRLALHAPRSIALRRDWPRRPIRSCRAGGVYPFPHRRCAKQHAGSRAGKYPARSPPAGQRRNAKHGSAGENAEIGKQRSPSRGHRR